MKLGRLLALPWYGASSARWSVGALIFLAVLMSAVIGFASAYTPPLSVDWMRAAIDGLAFLNLAMWATLLPNILLMAYAARRLQVPGAQRDACFSLSFYALLSIVLPVALIGVIGGDVAVVAIELVLGAGLGMAFAVLPSYGTSVLFFVALLHGVVWRWLGLPNDMQPGFLPLVVPLAIALWLAIAWLWRRALSPQATLDGLHAPMFFLVRLGKWQRLLGVGNATTDTQLAGQIPGWLRATIDLAGSGPGDAVQSLRVALGETFMPQTRSSQVRRTVIFLLACLLGGGLLVLQVVGYAEQGNGMPLAIGVRFLLMSCVPFASVTLAVVTANTLRQRWSRRNAELPLLAFAGTFFSRSNLVGLAVLGVLWLCLPLISVLVSHVPVPALGLVVAIGWVAAGVLLWLGRHGWRALKRLPHPFLAH